MVRYNNSENGALNFEESVIIKVKFMCYYPLNTYRTGKILTGN